MKKSNLYVWALVCCVSGLVACDNKDAVTPVKTKEGPLLSKITTEDGVHARFTYDEQHRLAEVIRYNRQDEPESAETFTYDGQGNLTRSNVKSNSLGVPTQSYTTYEYDKQDRLRMSLNYFKLSNQDFEYRSFVTYAYNVFNHLVQKNTYAPDSALRQYQTFAYDSRHNVIESSNYSYNFVPAGSPAVRTSKVVYTVDNQVNPYHTPSLPALSPAYANPNNVVQTNSTYFNSLHPDQNSTVNDITYEYDEKGYPVRMIENDVAYQLAYISGG